MQVDPRVLLEVLERCEWPAEKNGRFCQMCGRLKAERHNAVCTLAALIRRCNEEIAVGLDNALQGCGDQQSRLDCGED